MRIGIIKEEKIPTDNRVPFTPNQVSELIKQFPKIEFYVQPSDLRCFSDVEYQKAGAILSNDISHCDVLFGVKEVPIQSLVPGKTYFFFSHTIKKQSYNKKLLQTIVDKGITLVDYETLVNEHGQRLVAFGRWAGVVGAYNGLRLWAEIHNTPSLIPAHSCFDYNDLKSQLDLSSLKPLKIAVSGDGRVARGSWELLDQAGITCLSIDEFLTYTGDKHVYTKLTTDVLYKLKTDNSFNLQYFFKHPDLYVSRFNEYWSEIDLFINAVYWDPNAPLFFTLDDLSRADFNISAIADITCDIEGSVPCTLKATTIDSPFMSIDKKTHAEVSFLTADAIHEMSVDNLPNELPRDASDEFGEALSTQIIPDLLGSKEIINRATITKKGVITPKFQYLQEWLFD
ncbi:alanine dehydrogenase [bacterium]|nr:MAG: alanine dehydrogenase [bacterium]